MYFCIKLKLSSAMGWVGSLSFFFSIFYIQSLWSENFNSVKFNTGFKHHCSHMWWCAMWNMRLRIVCCARLLRNVYMSPRWWRVISTRIHMNSWKRMAMEKGVANSVCVFGWKSDTCEGIIVWNMRLRLHKCTDYFHLYMVWNVHMYTAQFQSIGIEFFFVAFEIFLSNSLKFNATLIRPYYGENALRVNEMKGFHCDEFHKWQTIFKKTATYFWTDLNRWKFYFSLKLHTVSSNYVHNMFGSYVHRKRWKQNEILFKKNPRHRILVLLFIVLKLLLFRERTASNSCWEVVIQYFHIVITITGEDKNIFYYLNSVTWLQTSYFVVGAATVTYQWDRCRSEHAHYFIQSTRKLQRAHLYIFFGQTPAFEYCGSVNWLPTHFSMVSLLSYAE